MVREEFGSLLVGSSAGFSRLRALRAAFLLGTLQDAQELFCLNALQVITHSGKSHVTNQNQTPQQPA